MSQGLHCISTAQLCDLYNITPRTAHRWLAGRDPAPRHRCGAEHFYTLADLLPRVPDPKPILRYARQRRLVASSDADLGPNVQERAKRLWASLTDAERDRAAAIQSNFRETVAKLFWEKVLHLDASYLSEALLIHPSIIQSIFGDKDLPESWDDFCIAFTLKNTPTKGIWRLAKSTAFQEGYKHAA